VNELDVLLVGPYPPPFGGISAHVARLADAIAAHGMSVRVLNHFRAREGNPLILGDLRRNPWRYWRALRVADARVVHYHHARWSTLVASALALHRSSSATIATIHGEDVGRYLESGIPGVAQLTRRALKTFDVLIAVSVEAKQALQAVVDQPISVIPAYIPVGTDQMMLSAEADAFLQQGVNLVVAAYRLAVDGRGRTIYGLETAIDSFKALAPAQPALRLAIFLAEPPGSRRESDRLRSLIERVDDPQLRRRIGIFYGEPLTPALRMAALYLRPTLTDGDAVSIREAIDAGVPVLASDVVVRPRGVRVVPLELSRWTAAIEKALACPERVHHTPDEGDSLEELIAIYKRLRGCDLGGLATTCARHHEAA
jgi:glycosyltransferase involved in cell wall biosynthesis